MRARVQRALILASQLDNDLRLMAVDVAARGRGRLDTAQGDAEFEQAAEYRRLAEFAGGIIREMEALNEALRPMTERELRVTRFSGRMRAMVAPLRAANDRGRR